MYDVWRESERRVKETRACAKATVLLPDCRGEGGCMYIRGKMVQYGQALGVAEDGKP